MAHIRPSKEANSHMHGDSALHVPCAAKVMMRHALSVMYKCHRICMIHFASFLDELGYQESDTRQSVA